MRQCSETSDNRKHLGTSFHDRQTRLETVYPVVYRHASPCCNRPGAAIYISGDTPETLAINYADPYNWYAEGTNPDAGTDVFYLYGDTGRYLL